MCVLQKQTHQITNAERHIEQYAPTKCVNNNETILKKLRAFIVIACVGRIRCNLEIRFDFMGNDCVCVDLVKILQDHSADSDIALKKLFRQKIRHMNAIR